MFTRTPDREKERDERERRGLERGGKEVDTGMGREKQGKQGKKTESEKKKKGRDIGREGKG